MHNRAMYLGDIGNPDKFRAFDVDSDVLALHQKQVRKLLASESQFLCIIEEDVLRILSIQAQEMGRSEDSICEKGHLDILCSTISLHRNRPIQSST